MREIRESIAKAVEIKDERSRKYESIASELSFAVLGLGNIYRDHQRISIDASTRINNCTGDIAVNMEYFDESF